MTSHRKALDAYVCTYDCYGNYKKLLGTKCHALGLRLLSDTRLDANYDPRKDVSLHHLARCFSNQGRLDYAEALGDLSG